MKDVIKSFRVLTLWLLCIIGVFIMAHQARAEEPVLPVELEGYDLVDGTFEYFPSTPDTLYFFGGIKEGFASALDKALVMYPDIKYLSLYSGGGLVHEALLAVRILEDKDIITYVPKGGTCQSACGYIFLVGSERVLDGTLGAHGMSVEVEDELPLNVAYKHVQEAVGYIMAVLYPYNVPTGYYVRMLLTPSDSMYIFTDAESKIIATGVDNERFDHIDSLVSIRIAFLTKYYEDE
jgi:hypothetical protein